MRITVFIISYNAEKTIERSLRSVQWADEIVVMDSYSTDRTVEICKRYTNQVSLRKFTDYADQKNFVLSQATSEWVLSLDTDEEVTEDLKSEILKIIETPGALEGYRIPRRSFIFGREFKYSGTQDDRPIRLFRKDRARFEQPIHEIVRIDGKIGVLTTPLLHYTYDTVSDYWERFNRYTSLEAEFLKDRNHSLTWLDLAARPPLTFLRLYCLKQGFRDGWEGFLFCFLSATYVFVKYAKFGEIKPAD